MSKKKNPEDRLDPNPRGLHTPGVPLDKEKMKELIIKYGGNITLVARSMKCARQSITRIISTNPEIKAIVDEARDIQVDEVEDTFIRKAKSGDATSLIFFLKTRGRNRGYSQEYSSSLDSVARAALDFALNKSRNPAVTHQTEHTIDGSQT